VCGKDRVDPKFKARHRDLYIYQGCNTAQPLSAQQELGSPQIRDKKTVKSQ
jgi:hypothetical protein